MVFQIGVFYCPNQIWFAVFVVVSHTCATFHAPLVFQVLHLKLSPVLLGSVVDLISRFITDSSSGGPCALINLADVC